MRLRTSACLGSNSHVTTFPSSGRALANQVAENLFTKRKDSLVRPTTQVFFMAHIFASLVERARVSPPENNKQRVNEDSPSERPNLQNSLRPDRPRDQVQKLSLSPADFDSRDVVLFRVLKCGIKSGISREEE